MRYLSLIDVLELHRRLIAASGGAPGLHDMGALESALAQPLMTFDGEELYPTVIEKAAALGYSLIMNHPFVDGNKRIGHATLETFLVLNGLEIDAGAGEQEQFVLQVAAGQVGREALTIWLGAHVREHRP